MFTGTSLNEKLGTTKIRGASNREAAASSDLVVSTLPDNGHIETLTSLKDELAGKLVVVATIAWPPGPTSKSSAAEDAQEALGELIGLSGQLAEIEHYTGRNAPDVVT